MRAKPVSVLRDPGVSKPVLWPPNQTRTFLHPQITFSQNLQNQWFLKVLEGFTLWFWTSEDHVLREITTVIRQKQLQNVVFRSGSAKSDYAPNIFWYQFDAFLSWFSSYSWHLRDLKHILDRDGHKTGAKNRNKRTNHDYYWLHPDRPLTFLILIS